MSDYAGPPTDRGAELAVLGAAFLYGVDAMDRATGAGLRRGMFYWPAHMELWDVFGDLVRRRQPIDQVTVGGALTAAQRRIIPQEMLTELVTAASPLPAVESHAEAVRSAALLRQVIEAGTRIVQVASSAPLDRGRDALELARAALDSVESLEEERGETPVSETLEEVLDRIEAREVPGVSTGYVELDEKLGGGPEPGQVMVVAARPSVGKSMLGVNLVRNACLGGVRTAVWSLEMTRQELMQRFLSLQGGVPLARIRSGDVGEAEWGRLAKATAEIGSWPLSLNDASETSVADIRAGLRRMQRRSGKPGLVIVDYLQLLRPADTRIPRQEQVGAITWAAKAISKDFACPVVLLAQLNRQTEQRRNAKPVLSDLRESGAIENDADLVVLMHQETLGDGVMQLDVAKNRQGERGLVELEWDAARMLATDGHSRADREALWQARLSG